MILVLNSGSSSLKFKLYKPVGSKIQLILSGAVADIGKKKCRNHTLASKKVMEQLKHNISDISAVGHRIVFGGKDCLDGEIATSSILQKLKSFAEIAPLHNPAAVETINCSKKHIKSNHYLFYDSSFYNALGKSEKIIAIDQKIAETYNIEKYGFHGISHKFAYENSNACNHQKVISVHMGSGTSVTAIENGISKATSMGFTPLGGVMMLNRSGDLDPGVLLFLVKKIGIKNTHDMIMGNSGISGIMRNKINLLDVLFLAGEKVEDKNYKPKDLKNNKEMCQKAKIALEMFCNKIKQQIGAYSALMGGVDAIVFTGRAGFGSKVIRNKICKGLNYLNIKEIVLFPPDEELAIANMLFNIIK